MTVETVVSEPQLWDRFQASWREPKDIPTRKLIGTHYQREAFSITIGAGDTITTLALVEAVEMAAGRDLINGRKIAALRVLHLNAAQTQDEIDRQIAGIRLHYGASPTDLGGRLIGKSILTAPVRLGVMGGNGVAAIDAEAMQRLVDFIRDERIDVVQLLPWVSFHAVRWNSGTDMDILAKEGLCAIAGPTQCAIGIFHEVRTVEKPTRQTTEERLAFALTCAAHSVRTLAVMSKTEARRFNIGETERRRCICIDSKAKAGPAGESTWFKLAPVELPNGESVEVAAPWSAPDPVETVTAEQMEQFKNLINGGLYSSDPGEYRWVGFAIARAIGIDLSSDNVRDDPQHLAKIKKIIEAAGAERKRRKHTTKRGSAGVAKSRAASKRSKPRTAA
jgi:hypothetical protein